MRSHVPTSSKPEPRRVASSVALAGCLRLFLLWLKPDGELVQHIPDDAFYYLVPARNFVRLGRWTFDGVEPATGFHLLWGYFLALLLRIDAALSFHAIFATAGFVQVVCLAGAAFLLTRAATRLFGSGAGWGIAVVFLSSTVLVQGGWLMESAFVILISAGVVDSLARRSLQVSVTTVALFVLLGGLLELSRSDAGLLAAFLLAMHLVLWRNKHVSHTMPVAASGVLAGSVFGVLTILLHTHWVSGGWLQASARQKLFWSSVQGRSSLRAVAGTPLSVWQPLHDAVPHYGNNLHLFHLASVAGHLLGFAVLAAMLAGASATFLRAGALARGVLLTLCLMVCAYGVFYQHDGALFDWYISNFAAAMALISAAATAWFFPRAPLTTVIVSLTLAIAGCICSLVPNGPWQECMYRAGIYLRDHRLPAAQGAFNAGIVGFFAEQPVVNLDGLVNDSILPYAVQGRLAEYMAKRNVAYIFDAPFMLEDPPMQRRGGYANGKLRTCLRDAADTFPDDPNNTWENGHIHLYRFDLSCLRQPGR